MTKNLGYVLTNIETFESLSEESSREVVGSFQESKPVEIVGKIKQVMFSMSRNHTKYLTNIQVWAIHPSAHHISCIW